MSSFCFLLLTLLALISLVTSSPTSLPTTSHQPTSTITATLSPLPAPSGALTPNETSAAAHLHYQPIYNIDYPGQDVFPWFWAPTYEDCLRRCDTYNANHTINGAIKCKADLFAPGRLTGLNDCYLKKSLHRPQLANLTLIGGIKLERDRSAVSSSSSKVAVSTRIPVTRLSSVHATTVVTHSASSSSGSDISRYSITFSTTDSASESQSESSNAGSTTSKVPAPHVSTASELSRSSSSETAVLTLPTSDHSHKV